jgi:predicted nucleotidyltransferase component of viral defense system
VTATRNLPASVRQRLLNVARSDGRPFGEVLQYFAMERLLYRLSQSRHASRFVLKGALLLRVWDSPLGRPTMDIDLLGMTANNIESIGRQVREVLEVAVEPDGLEFNPDTIEVQRIVEDAAYHGVRVRVLAFLARARIRLQVDIGFGDPVHPAAVLEEFPRLLEFPAAKLMCYSRESVLAGEVRGDGTAWRAQLAHEGLL